MGLTAPERFILWLGWAVILFNLPDVPQPSGRFILLVMATALALVAIFAPAHKEKK